MRKSLLFKSFAISMSMIILAGCGSVEKTADMTENAGASDSLTTIEKAETPASEGISEAEDVGVEEATEESSVESVDSGLGDYVMIICHSQPEGTPRCESLEKFAEDVKERTDGHVNVTVYGSGQLGNEKEMFEQVVTGEVQGMRGGNFDHSKRLLMFTAPFLTSSRAEISALLDSELAKTVCQELNDASGVIIISLCDAGGYRQFSNNIRPIKGPEDLEGLVMRTNGMKTVDYTFAEMGATTISVPYAELYMALKSGEADGQENPWVNVQGMRFYEVQKYFTEVNYMFHPDPFYVNEEWWNDLPEEYQTIILECAEDMCDYNDQYIDQESEAAKQAIIDAGAEVYEPTDEELEAFKKSVESVYDMMIEEGICTQEEIDEMKRIVSSVN